MDQDGYRVGLASVRLGIRPEIPSHRPHVKKSIREKNESKVKEILKCDLDEMKFREVTECFGSSTPVVDWMKVMANSAIVNILVPLLDHTSLKYLRETCQTLNETVRRNSNFLDRTLIIIEPGESDNHLNGLEMLGKNLILQIDDWKEKDDDFQKILNLLPSVESLEVRVDDPENIVVVEFIRLILAGSGLKELVIRQNVIPVYDSDELRPFVNQQSTIWNSIKKLKSLRLDMYIMVSLNPNTSMSAAYDVTLAGFPFELDWKDFYIDMEEPPSAITCLLEKYSRTMTTLHLGEGLWDTETALKLVLPALRELEVETGGDELPDICTFINKQPLLEKLSLTFSMLTKRAKPLLDTLQSRGSQLKKFHLEWTYSNRPPVPPVAPVDANHPPPQPEIPWDFSVLEIMRNLEDLKIRQIGYFLKKELQEDRTSVETILSSTPDSVKRIDLSGAPLSTDASLGTVIESLSRFTSLTVFNVIQCPNALDDKVLQFICSKLTQLREFGFSHCDYVTDFGLTGCQDGEVTRPGLGFLTGLKQLKIISCKALTLEGYLSAISFRDLTKLVLIIMEEAPQSFYVKLVKQNKNLGLLVLSNMSAPLTADDADGNLVEIDLDTRLLNLSCRLRYVYFKTPLRRVLGEDDDHDTDDGGPRRGCFCCRYANRYTADDDDEEDKNEEDGEEEDTDEEDKTMEDKDVEDEGKDEADDEDHEIAESGSREMSN